MSKLILTNEVAGLGSAGDVVDVKDGYARNYLIPQGFAVQWTRGGEAGGVDSRRPRGPRLPRPRRGRGAEEPSRVQHRQADRQGRRRGRLFGSVKTGDVADAVKAAGLGELDKRTIHITSPIKAVGEHEATVRLRDDLTAVITLLVIAAK